MTMSLYPLTAVVTAIGSDSAVPEHPDSFDADLFRKTDSDAVIRIGRVTVAFGEDGQRRIRRFDDVMVRTLRAFDSWDDAERDILSAVDVVGYEDLVEETMLALHNRHGHQVFTAQQVAEHACIDVAPVERALARMTVGGIVEEHPPRDGRPTWYLPHEPEDLIVEDKQVVAVNLEIAPEVIADLLRLRGICFVPGTVEVNGAISRVQLPPDQDFDPALGSLSLVGVSAWESDVAVRRMSMWTVDVAAWQARQS